MYVNMCDHNKILEIRKKFPRSENDFRFWTSKKCPFFKSPFFFPKKP